MPTRQQPTMRKGAIRSLLGILLLLFFFGFSPIGRVLAQEPGVSDASSVTGAGTVPDLISAPIGEDANWTASNVTLSVPETISSVSDPANGSTRITGDAKDVEYKPDADYCNIPPGTTTDNFTYTILPGGAIGAVNMTVICVNDAPEINAPADVQTLNQDTTRAFTTISVDDVDAGNARLRLDLSASQGALTLAQQVGLTAVSGNGTGAVSAKGSLTNLNAALNGLTYSPASGYVGNDNLAIDLDDQGNTGNGVAKTDDANVAITVEALSPTVKDDTDETDQEVIIWVDVLANDVANSGDMDPASVTVKIDATNGATLPRPSGKIRYTPDNGFVGQDSFTYEACNDGGKCGMAEVSVQVNPLAPTLKDDTAETDENIDKDIDVLANDIANTGSMNANSVTVIDGSEPAHGSAVPLASGKILYAPDANYNGDDSFTYEACNTAGVCGSAVVNITVNPVDDKPTIEPIDDQTMIAGSTKIVDVIINDIDSNELTVRAESDNTALLPNESLIVSGAGNNRTLQIMPTDNQIGRANITVFVSDGQSEESTTFSVDVIAPDLNVLIDDGGVSVRPGNTVAYVIDYGNSPVVFTSDATGVYVEVTVPEHSRFNAATSDNGWNCTNNGEAEGVCRLDIGQLKRGESGSAALALDVSLAVPENVDLIAVEAKTGDDGQHGDDTDPSNNRDKDATPIDRAVVLLATKRDVIDVSGGNDGIAGPGDRIIYTVMAHNESVTTALDAVFNDTPDSNTMLEVGSVTVSQGEITQGNAPGDDAVSIALGEIVPDAIVTIKFSVLINIPVPDGVNQVANQGSISGENFPTAQTSDPDTSNVGDATVTPLGAIPVLNAAKRAGLLIDANQDGLASPGDTLSYTVTLSNQGVVKATNTLFSDKVDPNTKLVNGSVLISDPGADIVSGNTDGDTVVTIDIGTLNSAEVVTITFAAKIDGNLPSSVVQVANQGIVSSQEIPLLMTNNPDTLEPNDPTKTPVVIEPILVPLKIYKLVGDADGNGKPSPGDTIEYSINIRNDGTRASGIVFTDKLDSHVRLTRGTPDQPYVQTSRGTVVSGNNAGDSTVVVTMDELGTGDSANISFKVKIAATVPADLLFIENQGVASSAEVEDIVSDDPETDALDDTTKTPITGSVSLDATMTARMVGDMDSSGGYSEGDIVIYTVTVRNSGNRAAPEVFLDVRLDERTEIYSDVNFPQPELPIPLGTIPAGDVRLTGIMVKLVNLGEIPELANQFGIDYFDPDAAELKTIPTNDPMTAATDDPTVIEIQPVFTDLFLPIVAASAN